MTTKDASRRRFFILGVVFLSYLLVFLARLSVGPLAPFLKDAFDLSSAQVGGLMSATAITYAPTLVVAGWLVDWVGVRRMLVAGTLIASLCIIVMFWAPSYPGLLVLLALSSLGAGCIYPSAVRAVVLWFPVTERATAIGVNQMAINVSGIIAALSLPVVAERYGWEYGFLAVGLMGLMVTALVAAGYRSPSSGPGAGLGWVVVVLIALLGLGAIGWGGICGTMAGEIGGRAAAGQVAGLTAAAVNVGVVFGPPAFGAIVDATGSYGWAWLAMAISSAFAIACALFVREPREHDPAARVEFDEA